MTFFLTGLSPSSAGLSLAAYLSKKSISSYLSNECLGDLSTFLLAVKACIALEGEGDKFILFVFFGPGVFITRTYFPIERAIRPPVGDTLALDCFGVYLEPEAYDYC